MSLPPLACNGFPNLTSATTNNESATLSERYTDSYVNVPYVILFCHRFYNQLDCSGKNLHLVEVTV